MMNRREARQVANQMAEGHHEKFVKLIVGSSALCEHSSNTFTKIHPHLHPLASQLAKANMQ